MPFQSEKQRRFLHANHPEIAKRWERDYANGGILDINESEEIISDDGNDIELTAYNAAFDDPNDLSTGVKSLFQAKDGGTPRRRYFKGAYGAGGTENRGSPSAGTAGSTGWGGPDSHGDVAHGDGGRFDVANTKTTTTSTKGDGPTHPNVHEDETQKSIKDALNEGQRKRDLARISLQTYKPTAKKEKIENTPEAKGFWDHLSTVLGILTLGPIFGVKMPGIVNTLSSVVSTKQKLDTLTTYGIKKGWLDENMTVDKLTEKFVEHTKKQKAKKDEYDSLPSGHPDKIALGIELQIGRTTDDGDGGDEPKPPQIRPIGEKIEEYTEMAAQPMSMLDKIRAGQAKRAMVNPDWQQQPGLAFGQQLFNSGGLANLFRVKNNQ